MQKNLTEDKFYKVNLEENSMLNKFTKDDLIGRIRKGIDNEGKTRELFWPKVSELRILGLRFPIYSQLPQFTRDKGNSINERIKSHYGAVEIIGNKVYSLRSTFSLEELM